MNKEKVYTGDDPNDAGEVCIALFEGESVLVANWHSSSALRRQVFRTQKKFEEMYHKTLTVASTPLLLGGQNVVRLSPDLTKDLNGGKLDGHIQL